MTIPTKGPLALVILDGWGHSSRQEGNAIALANTPNYDAVCANFPMTTLIAAGMPVGQSPDAIGNPEVGHLNIGSGRAAQAEVFRVERAINSGDFQKNEILKNAFAIAAAKGSTLHLIGLLSDGGVHSSSETLFALLRLAKIGGLTDIAVHCILDGVDVPIRTADIYVEALEIKLADIGIGRIATLCGRYFAMDSRGNWERTARAYTMLVHAEGERSRDAVGSIRNSFLRGIADEFIAPIIIEDDLETPSAIIKDGDVVIYFNHRPETMRQLVRSLSVPDSIGSPKPMIDSICMTEYDRGFGLAVAFPPETASLALTDILGASGIRNFKVTQTERFPHLTYFFNGGAESQMQTEQNILVPTPKMESVELHPESQSFKITDKLLRSIESTSGGVFIVNIPAADLVAETGRIDKTVESIQFIDTCLGGIVDKVLEFGGTAIITSTHGNCEEMTNVISGETNYLATANRVPFHLVGDASRLVKLRDDGVLADIAPTILALLDLDKPAEMTGADLRVN